MSRKGEIKQKRKVRRKEENELRLQSRVSVRLGAKNRFSWENGEKGIKVSLARPFGIERPFDAPFRWRHVTRGAIVRFKVKSRIRRPFRTRYAEGIKDIWRGTLCLSSSLPFRDCNLIRNERQGKDRFAATTRRSSSRRGGRARRVARAASFRDGTIKAINERILFVPSRGNEWEIADPPATPHHRSGENPRDNNI